MTLSKNNISDISNIELSIQISLSGLSFCILQKSTNTIIELKHYKFNKHLTPLETLDKLKHLFNTERSLQQAFEKIYIIHDNELSTLVPKPIFNKDVLADYLKFNSKILKSDFIAYEDININESVNVYVPYININNYIFDKFGSFTFKHISTILIQQVLLIEKHANVQKMYVNVNPNHFEIILVNQGDLIFYNTFNYKTKEDFIYYLLFTIEQLKLNPETLNLVLTGNINKQDALYDAIYKYIRFVYFGNREDNYKYSVEAQPNSYHSDFALLNSF